MIKKIYIILVICLGMMGCGKVLRPALANEISILTTLKELTPGTEINLSETLNKLPALKQGVAYSILDNDFNYLSTLEVAKWKGFTLEGGYSSKDKAVIVVSYEILKLKDIIDLPILNLVEFNLGLYGGYGRINMQALDKSEWDGGISLTLISVKF